MLDKAPLGKTTLYIQTYTPQLLFPVSRAFAREKIILSGALPFNGWDVWNGTELSWLNPKGKPEVGILQMRFPATSVNVIESKSLKLYLNSFNQSKFPSLEAVRKTIEKDVSAIVEGDVNVLLQSIFDATAVSYEGLPGESLDLLDVMIDTYTVSPAFLSTQESLVSETLHSGLLKSNCLATGQPDWGSMIIRYQGQQIQREGLLKYIISYRNHAGFAEHCAEQIFCDLLEYCKMELLSVYILYTRRGGLDINPFRSNFETLEDYISFRDLRQ